MALLRYGTDTQQSEDTYPNYREFMRNILYVFYHKSSLICNINAVVRIKVI